MITKEELLSKLKKTEWTDFEVKEALEKLPKNVWETVSSFSNSQGGWIVFGIVEHKKKTGTFYEIQGVQNGEKLESLSYAGTGEYLGLLQVDIISLANKT